MNEPFARWRANFFTGLAVVLPAVISIWLVVLVFNQVSTITDALLFFLPRRWTHQQAGQGPMFWYWSLLAFLLAVLLITLLGRLTRYYIGKKMIQLVDRALLQVPLLNKIYSTLKQVNEAFTSGSKSAFKQVVLVQFPRQGQYSLGFITGEQHDEVQAKTDEKVISVFVPTTPNPTTGFLILVPEHEIVRLDMSVADGIKFIISLGSVSPEYKTALPELPTPTPLRAKPQPLGTPSHG
jgi:uncharacterized membrane protein